MASRSPEAASAAVDAATRQLDNGFLRVFGTGRKLLAELRFNRPAFLPARNGTAEVARMTPDHRPQTGRPVTWEAWTLSGVMALRGRVGDELVFDRATIVAGSSVIVDRFTYTEAT